MLAKHVQTLAGKLTRYAQKSSVLPKLILMLSLGLFLFQYSFSEEELSIQTILIKAKEKSIDFNDATFMKKMETAYSKFLQSKEIKDANKIQISLDVLALVQPLMKNEGEKAKIVLLRNMVLTNLRAAVDNKKIDNKKINEIESIIGSNEYLMLFFHKSDIGTDLNLLYENPIIKVKELTNENKIKMSEFSQLSNEVEFFLFNKEKTLENKLELILATFELSKNISEIMKKESDTTIVGWYGVINETMREQSIRYLVMFQSDAEKKQVVEKFMPAIKKFLSESEIKVVNQIKKK